MKQLFITIGTLIAITLNLSFADSYRNTRTESRTTEVKRDYRTTMNRSILFFDEREWSFDLFGTYAATESGLYDDGFGGGVGVNYFFTRYLGVGIDGYWWDGSPAGVVSSISGSLIGRLPMDELHLAPYVFAGGGGHFNSVDQASGHAGLGLEYRFTPNFALFSDGRYVFTDETNDFGLIRFGVRFPF